MIQPRPMTRGEVAELLKKARAIAEESAPFNITIRDIAAAINGDMPRIKEHLLTSAGRTFLAECLRLGQETKK